MPAGPKWCCKLYSLGHDHHPRCEERHLTATTRLVLRDREDLRAHLDMLNEAGKSPIAVGADDRGLPFLITLVGPYAEGEAVFFDSPWQSDVDWRDGSTHCTECNGHEHGIEHLRFPVTLLQVLTDTLRVVG